MTLQSSGIITAEDINVELGRASNAAMSMNGVAERALADIPSGAVSFSNFYGKTREIRNSTTMNYNQQNIQNFFSASDWAGPATKVFIVPVGFQMYSSTSTVAALRTGTGRGGLLRIENRGSILGGPGAPSGGVGGDALLIEQEGVTVYNYGSLYSGGGAGGYGGVGGPGTYQTPYTYQEGPIYNQKDPHYWHPNGNGTFTAYWNGTYLGVGIGNGASIGGWQYWAGAVGGPGPLYTIYRTQTRYTTNSSSGGLGGFGGRGQGFDGAAQSGTAGYPAGTAAGNGGAGGSGGNWGLSGSPGNTGNAGNAGGGSGGGPAGLAGFAIKNLGGTAIIALAGDMKGR